MRAGTSAVGTKNPTKKSLGCIAVGRSEIPQRPGRKEVQTERVQCSAVRCRRFVRPCAAEHVAEHANYEPCAELGTGCLDGHLGDDRNLRCLKMQSEMGGAQLWDGAAALIGPAQLCQRIPCLCPSACVTD